MFSQVDAGVLSSIINTFSEEHQNLQVSWIDLITFSTYITAIEYYYQLLHV